MTTPPPPLPPPPPPPAVTVAVDRADDARLRSMVAALGVGLPLAFVVPMLVNMLGSLVDPLLRARLNTIAFTAVIAIITVLLLRSSRGHRGLGFAVALLGVPSLLLALAFLAPGGLTSWYALQAIGGILTALWQPAVIALARAELRERLPALRPGWTATLLAALVLAVVNVVFRLLWLLTPFLGARPEFDARAVLRVVNWGTGLLTLALAGLLIVQAVRSWRALDPAA